MKAPLEHKITEYLSVGGLCNPELMGHDKVRSIIMECRDMLAVQRERIESLDQGQSRIAAIANDMERQRDDAMDSLQKEQSNSDRLASCLSIWYNASGSRCMTSDADALASHEVLKSQR
jgi:hypothetical protein